MWHLVVGDSFREHWKDWQVRLLVLSSVLLQIIYIPIGTHRKTTKRAWIQFLIWITYLTAESIPIMTVGAISNWLSDLRKASHTFQAVEPKYELFALWAPIVLVHLGGPHSMTAYSLEDNELWFRHLARVFIQIGWTCYILFMALSNSQLSYIAIPVILVGILKNFERIWSMFHASKNEFRSSLIPPPRSGRFYATLSEISGFRKKEGYAINLESTREIRVPEVFSPPKYFNLKNPADRYMFMASQLIKTFKVLFADLISNFSGVDQIKALFTQLKSDEAFQIIQMELDLMFESLYTKARIIHKPWGTVSKITTLLLTLGLLLAFCMVNKKEYEFKLDVSITFIAILGLLLSEIHSIFNVISSDTLYAFFIEREWTFGHQLVLYVQSCNVLRWLGITTGDYRWSSGSLGQVNILGLAAYKTPKLFSYNQSIKRSYEKMKQYLSVAYLSMDEDKNLRRWVYTYLIEKLKELDKDQHPSGTSQRADSLAAYDFRWITKSILRDMGLPDLMWIAETDFTRFIVIWHIVTEIQYHDDKKNVDNDDLHEGETIDQCDHENSRTLSNYLIYLLVQRPTMWPIASAGDDYYAHTLSEAQNMANPKGIYQMLQEVVHENAIPPEAANNGENVSVLFHASHFASQLKKGCSLKKRWDMVGNIWREALLYLAYNSDGDVHAKELIYGEELLTFIWLLMAHFGISKQVESSTKFAFTRLVLS